MHSVESACLRILHTSQRNGAFTQQQDIWLDGTLIYLHGSWRMRCN